MCLLSCQSRLALGFLVSLLPIVLASHKGLSSHGVVETSVMNDTMVLPTLRSSLPDVQRAMSIQDLQSLIRWVHRVLHWEVPCPVGRVTHTRTGTVLELLKLGFGAQLTGAVASHDGNAHWVAPS